jgi:hypothetical protein
MHEQSSVALAVNGEARSELPRKRTKYHGVGLGAESAGHQAGGRRLSTAAPRPLALLLLHGRYDRLTGHAAFRARGIPLAHLVALAIIVELLTDRSRQIPAKEARHDLLRKKNYSVRRRFSFDRWPPRTCF